jgi:hypothetical protein
MDATRLDSRLVPRGRAEAPDFNKEYPRAFATEPAYINRGQFDRQYAYERARTAAREQRRQQLAMDTANAKPAVLMALANNPPRDLHLFDSGQIGRLADVLAEHHVRELRGEQPIDLGMDMRMFAGDAVAQSLMVNKAMNAPYHMPRQNGHEITAAEFEDFLTKQRLNK